MAAGYNFYTKLDLSLLPLVADSNPAYMDLQDLYNAIFTLAAQIDKVLTLSDDVRVNNADGGLILKDHQGTPHYWRVTVSNVGALIVTDIGTSLP